MYLSTELVFPESTDFPGASFDQRVRPLDFINVGDKSAETDGYYHIA